MEDELPNDIEFYLISLGFFKSERPAGAIRNAPIQHPKTTEQIVSVGWRPSHRGEEPPF
jgi:hypothetical protein